MVTNLFCFIEVCDTPASKLFVLVYIVSMFLVFAYLPKGKQKKSTKKVQEENAA
ncbi:MAG: hypothetical protein WAQ28_12070 [Bacteroidia bacterium]|jgi:preprotein translocase subunit YajC